MVKTTFKPFHLERADAKDVITIQRKYLISLFILFCLVTPGTNWMIAFANKIKDIIYVRNW